MRKEAGGERMSPKLKENLFKRSMWTLLTVFFTFILIIVLIASSIASMNAMFVDTFFGAKRYILIPDKNAEETDTQYYKSEFAKKDENGNLILATGEDGIKHQILDTAALRANSLDVCERVNEEGSVLLWNNGALPLKKGDKVSNFGIGTISWVYHGFGSGYVSIETPLDMKASLTSRGLQVNDEMFDALRKGERFGYAILRGAANDMPWDEYTSASIASVSTYGDAAIYTVSRFCGESADINGMSTVSEDGSILSFSKAEISVLAGLQQLKKDGKLKSIVLVIDCANALSLKNVEKYDVDACLWVGLGGNASLDALADILVGNANPSGHLTDTWVYDVQAAPSSANFGDISYKNVTQKLPPVIGAESHYKYLVYQEGIYVGYRYYETRYEDLVLGAGKADSVAGVKHGSGKWSYGGEVVCAFGHGESYTDFEYSDYSVKHNGKNYEVTMTIKNVGEVAGKDVMQVYLQKPYTDYDKANKIEKAAVELVGFEKTKLLGPGESDTLTVTVPEYEFKSYDSYGKGTYILEKGDYYLATGTDAHNALNNILAAKGKTTADGMDENGNASLTHKVTYKNDDFETYSVSPFTGAKIANRFDNADVNRYEGTEGQSVVYLSRSNWEDTYPGGAALSLTTEKMANEIRYDWEVPNNASDEMPVYNTVTSEYGKLNLVQLKGIPFGDPLWDDLLNQMTFEEQVAFVTSCAHAGAKSVAAPEFQQNDGPCGAKYSGMAFPCNPIVGSTYNAALVEELGKAFANEMMSVNTPGIYGVACNIHRSAYGGRAWEYYSEDGFLSGVMNAAESKGLRSLGAILYTKHFALNEQETCRSGVATWSNEQAIREIYLKAFERAVGEGYTNGIMTSYNRIGATWSGQHKGLLTDVLRGEWGFEGVTVTDAGSGLHHMGMTDNIYATGLIAGQDAWMGNITQQVFDQYKNNATVCLALREAAHRNLYVKVNSAAVNGMTSTTRVQEVMPNWEIALLVATILSAVFAALCLGMTAASWAVHILEKHKIPETNP